MRTMLSTVFLGVALASVGWGIVSALKITSELQKRRVKINWLFLRVLIIRYLGQYRDLTRKETGRIGFWYYSYIIAMNAALVFALTGLLSR